MGSESAMIQTMPQYRYGPRLIEFCAAIGTVAHELERRLLRQQHAHLPLPASIEQFYLYSGGDFMDGFTLSFTANLIGTIAARELQHAEGLVGRIARAASAEPGLVTAASTAVGISAVVFAETTGFLNSAYLSDIPAGITGALAYAGLRTMLLKHYTQS